MYVLQEFIYIRSYDKMTAPTYPSVLKGNFRILLDTMCIKKMSEKRVKTLRFFQLFLHTVARSHVPKYKFDRNENTVRRSENDMHLADDSAIQFITFHHCQQCDVSSLGLGSKCITSFLLHHLLYDRNRLFFIFFCCCCITQVYL